MDREFPLSWAISEVSRPLDWSEEKSALMVSACREMAKFHRDNCREIKAVYERFSFDPDSIGVEADLARIPWLGVAAMKHFLLTSKQESAAVLKLTSSGTRGQKTQVWFDQGSLDRVQRMMDVLLDQEGLISEKETNYLVLSYDPDDAGDLGLAYSDKNQLRFAPVRRVQYAVKKDSSGQWVYHKDRAYEVLCEYEKAALPVRIFGTPAFIFDFIEHLKGKGVRGFSLPSDSLILFAGGWKAAEDKQISRDEFRRLCLLTFGIPLERIRDGYGMAEHSAPYFECRHHRLHVPVFNRLIVRDPVTLSPVAPGTAGLLELITPFNAMMPTLAILSTDWAVLDADKCSCGWNSPTFRIVGRAGLSKHKGCAIHADEIVKRSK